jgi:folate-binding protein YgfZ
MSSQVTFKSTDEKTPQPGEQVAPAPRLSEAARPAYTPSHGRAPSEMPLPPVGLQDLGPAAAIRVVGPDREKWLQGMQSNDLGAASFGGAVAGVFLNGRGRLVAESLLWRRAEEVIVTTDQGRWEALFAHLDKLLIMEDCEISRADGLRRMRYFPGDVAPAGVPPQVAGSWQPLGLELLLPEAEAEALLETLRERPRPDQIEALRIARGVPVWGAELDEDTTPIEAGLDRMLSFSKGCYVGQEVVAMATYRGRVSWNLARLEVAGAAPAPGTRLDARSPKSRVTSSTQVGAVGIFLGYVRKELIVPGSQVPLEDGRAAEVLGLPYGSQPGAGVCA